MRIFPLDRDATVAWLESWARDLAARRPDVRRIVLFGSLARSDHRARSDADLLVELDRSENARWFDRIPDLLPSRPPVPVDLFPYTSEEIERMLAAGHSLVRRALREGVVLFAR